MSYYAVFDRVHQKINYENTHKMRSSRDLGTIWDLKTLFFFIFSINEIFYLCILNDKQNLNVRGHVTGGEQGKSSSLG